MIDAESTLCDNQDLSAAVVGNTLSETWYALPTVGTIPLINGNAPRDAGRASNADLFTRVTTAFDSANHTATVNFQLCHADDDNGTNLAVLRETGAILVTALTKGTLVNLGPKLPSGISKACIGLRMVVAVENLTAGALHSSLGLHADNAIAS